jgi:hypothetical protein
MVQNISHILIATLVGAADDLFSDMQAKKVIISAYCSAKTRIELPLLLYSFARVLFATVGLRLNIGEEGCCLRRNINPYQQIKNIKAKNCRASDFRDRRLRT